MALRDDIDELDDALFDWATQTYWKGNRKAPILAATIDPLTGRIEDLSNNVPRAFVPVGQKYAKVFYPFNQSGAASVLPTDYSGNNNSGSFGVNNSAPWAYPGWVTTYAASANQMVKVPLAAIAADLVTDSLIIGVTAVLPVTGSAYNLMGTGDGANAVNLGLVNGTTGLLGPRATIGGLGAFSGKYGTAQVGGGFVGANTGAAGYAIGATSVVIAAGGVGVITANDLIKFGTDPNWYTVSVGVASIAAGGTVQIPSPGLLKAIPAATTVVTLAGGPRVHRIELMWNAPTQTVYVYVDGVLDFSAVSDRAAGATELFTLPFCLGNLNVASTGFLCQFAGFEYLKFASSALPQNHAELAYLANLNRRSGMMASPVFL